MNVPVAAPAGLLPRLRAATAQAHAALERNLGFLSDPSDRGRILEALERFYGFHLVWVPPNPGSYVDQRSRWEPLVRRIAPTFGLGMDEIDCRSASG